MFACAHKQACDGAMKRVGGEEANKPTTRNNEEAGGKTTEAEQREHTTCRQSKGRERGGREGSTQEADPGKQQRKSAKKNEHQSKNTRRSRSETAEAGKHKGKEQNTVLNAVGDRGEGRGGRKRREKRMGKRSPPRKRKPSYTQVSRESRFTPKDGEAEGLCQVTFVDSYPLLRKLLGLYRCPTSLDRRSPLGCPLVASVVFHPKGYFHYLQSSFFYDRHSFKVTLRGRKTLQWIGRSHP